MKNQLLKTMLLLFALIAGSVSTWAAADVTYDFTGSGWTVTATSETISTLSNGTVSFTGSGPDNFKMNSGYFMMGKSGAYINFPIYTKDVEKIVVTGKSGASGSVKQNIYVGDTPVSSETTGATGANTYNIAAGYQAAGTQYTLKVTSSHNTQITKIEVYYAGSIDTRAEAELAWSAASATVTYGADDNIFPTLTNPHSVAVTYSSSNTSAATIDKSGKITIKDYSGTTTISAIFAGDETYKPQTVTYELTVNKAPFSVKDGIFDFVSAATAGKDYGSGVTTTSTSSEYVTESKTWTAGSVVMVTEGKYRWWAADGTLRFYTNKVSDKETTKFTLSVPAKKIITKVVFSGGNSFTPSSGTLSSTTWTGGANSVTFTYSKASGSNDVKSITVTYTDEAYAITPAKTYTTLTCAYPLDFSSVTNLTAYIVKDGDASDGEITLTKVNKVPAETGLVLKAEKTGSAIAVPVLQGEADDVTGNLMTGFSYKTIAIAANGGYILSDGKFHPAKEGKLPEGKAYLKLAVSASELLLDFDGGATGVADVRSKMEEVRGDFYDLQGRKVVKPTKGLYIVNGRKVIIK